MKYIVTVRFYNGYHCQYQVSSRRVAENLVVDALRNECVTNAYVDERREWCDLVLL